MRRVCGWDTEYTVTTVHLPQGLETTFLMCLSRNSFFSSSLLSKWLKWNKRKLNNILLNESYIIKHTDADLKGIVHAKMKINLFTHPSVVLMLYALLSFMDHKRQWTATSIKVFKKFLFLKKYHRMVSCNTFHVFQVF